MNKRGGSWLRFACGLLLLLAFFACDSGDDDDNDDTPGDDDDNDNDDDDDDDNDDDDNDDDDNDDNNDDDTSPAETWTDPETGLMWETYWWSPWNGKMPWSGANDHCDELELAGYDDWRLPTISELRTLIRGCPATETDGACNVTDDCLTNSCGNAACDGCPAEGGPNNDCYGHPELPGECNWFWSSSLLEGYEHTAWIVRHSFGSVTHVDMSDEDTLARCVRTAK